MARSIGQCETQAEAPMGVARVIGAARQIVVATLAAIPSGARRSIPPPDLQVLDRRGRTLVRGSANA